MSLLQDNNRSLTPSMWQHLGLSSPTRALLSVMSGHNYTWPDGHISYAMTSPCTSCLRDWGFCGCRQVDLMGPEGERSGDPGVVMRVMGLQHWNSIPPNQGFGLFWILFDLLGLVIMLRSSPFYC